MQIKITKNHSRSHEKMSDSLKMNYFFIGHQLTVNEICHQQNLDLKKDQSLSDLKKYEMIFSNNSSQIEIEFF